jgi:small conductance mechanosensitive channel
MITGELQLLLQKVLRGLPSILISSAILLISWGLAKLVYKFIPLLFRRGKPPSLLQEVATRGISISIFLIGVYFIFEMTELTTMALAILSGTGLIGIIFGIAFRDITENFLASVLLSLQNPFRTGDLIDVTCPVTGYSATGFVDRLTLRATILVSFEGNHIQIPNATVYKSNIRNYTTNPNHREDFIISISADSSIANAENAALKAVSSHEAVLKDPEPLVLVDSLSKDQVHLRIYYWIDVKKHNMLKVKSALIRLVKQALDLEQRPTEIANVISKITTALPGADKD